MVVEVIYLSLGSNVGAPEANLNTAIEALPAAGVVVRRVSSFYVTEPVDYLEQAWFLNSVVKADTELPALSLLRAVRGIESKMGSTKSIAKGPRLIDIDILLYGQQKIDTPELQVPHPRMTQRKFVLVPLTEIAPGLRHPAWCGTVEQLLAETPDKSKVQRVAPRTEP
jgi:2-amino-4-hydroxy-6-hydroxymethyldihydropteridine diphosphokinase